MKQLSLRFKLFAATFVAIVTLCLALVWSSYSGISGLTRNVGDYSKQTLPMRL